MTKRRMQTVDFASVEEFLAYLPKEERRVVDALRSIIFDCIPGVQEKLSYNVPFYKGRKNICFLWPGSILWGNKKSYEGVRMGFSAAYRMGNEDHFLTMEDRKFVGYKDFKSLQEINQTILKQHLFEAAILDAENKIKK